MTSFTKTRIAPDNALVIDLREFGISVSARELERLFVEFTNRHSQSLWQFELSPDGEIIAMPPVHHPSDGHEHDFGVELALWAREFGGVSRGSNSAYQMPVTGGVLAPDASWTSQEKWDAHAHTMGDSHSFCPDFVVEIRSTSDNLAPLQDKMGLYMQNGALLGWLIDPPNRRVYVYRAGRPDPQVLEDPDTLPVDDVLPGFAFDAGRWIFDRV